MVLDDLAGPADLDGLWPAGAGRVLVTAADAAALPGGVRVVPVGPFSVREAIGYLNGRVAADPDKRLGAIELARDLDFEPVALAQASAVIANFPMSCREYRADFVRRREQLAEPAGARPPAAAVTWTLSFGRADQLSPDRSAQRLLAQAALLDGHGIPQTVLAAPAAGDFLAGGGDAPAGSERALAALEQAGLLTVDPETAPPAVRISPVLQAALRAAMPEGMRDQAATVGRGRAAPGLAGPGVAGLARVRPAILRGGPAGEHRGPAVGRRLPSRAGAGGRQPGSRRPDRARGGALG